MSTDKTYPELEAAIVKALKNVYDPEIPVNVYDLGLIYEIDVKSEQEVDVTMTLTAPNCPMADIVLNDVETYVKDVKGIEKVNVILTFDPPWDKDMLSEEARLELGMM
ncbi:MAG: iron-sulfur cluster assembly protein [Bacteroidales bacterium]|nr:iron-sulfur cluster assembly protein [Bacteroidales bacterium]MDT8431770.1 iron-sulfur cluster assembly protein [Bacteroidales bacterium]